MLFSGNGEVKSVMCWRMLISRARNMTGANGCKLPRPDGTRRSI